LRKVCRFRTRKQGISATGYRDFDAATPPMATITDHATFTHVLHWATNSSVTASMMIAEWRIVSTNRAAFGAVSKALQTSRIY
jgi:hypothetical protein